MTRPIHSGRQGQIVGAGHVGSGPTLVRCSLNRKVLQISFHSRVHVIQIPLLISQGRSIGREDLKPNKPLRRLRQLIVVGGVAVVMVCIRMKEAQDKVQALVCGAGEVLGRTENSVLLVWCHWNRQ